MRCVNAPGRAGNYKGLRPGEVGLLLEGEHLDPVMDSFVMTE
ncbi:hypothetical protein ACFUJY_29945 [Streptomyces sp. NPDC057249]